MPKLKTATQTLTDFLTFWQAGKFGRMLRLSQQSWQATNKRQIANQNEAQKKAAKPKGRGKKGRRVVRLKPVDTLKMRFSHATVTAFDIMPLPDQSGASIEHFLVNITYENAEGKTQTGSATVNVICERSGKPSTSDRGGVWGVNPHSVLGVFRG